MNTWADPLIEFWRGHRGFRFNVHPEDLDTFYRFDPHWAADPESASTTPPIHSDRFLGEVGERFITSLKPVPYCGDLRSAKAIVLLLNPGFHPGDHLAEQNPAYLDAINGTTEQRFRGGLNDYPLFVLNPEFAASPGYAWWAKKFAGLATEIQRQAGLSKTEAFKRIAQRVATLELVPYHSRSLGIRKFERSLASYSAARDAIGRLLRVQANGSPTVIVTRGAGHWIDAPSRPAAEQKGWIIYSAGQARGASLGPATAGGAALLEACLHAP